MNNHEEAIKRVRSFKIIYIFISKILKAAHFKITRQYAKETSLQNFVQEFLGESPDVLEEMEDFCEAWNELAAKKYELRYLCHAHG